MCKLGGLYTEIWTVHALDSFWSSFQLKMTEIWEYIYILKGRDIKTCGATLVMFRFLRNCHNQMLLFVVLALQTVKTTLTA